eukprot:scaffold512214_cov47-Prasinocladus_malaysianus.AAC.1
MHGEALKLFHRQSLDEPELAFAVILREVADIDNAVLLGLLGAFLQRFCRLGGLWLEETGFGYHSLEAECMGGCQSRIHGTWDERCPRPLCNPWLRQDRVNCIREGLHPPPSPALPPLAYTCNLKWVNDGVKSLGLY